MFFFDDTVDIGNLISGSSAFSKISLKIWKGSNDPTNFFMGIYLKVLKAGSLTDICTTIFIAQPFPVAQCKESACNAGAIGNAGLILGLVRSLGGGHGNPLQYSCLENPTEKGAWWATVHGISKNWIQRKQLSSQARTFTA